MSHPPQPGDESSDQALLAAADQCVKCGLCLDVCPTYRLEGRETASPRGRLSIAQGLMEGRLPWSEGAWASLDGCLGCRACERVCPSEVPYGRVLDGIRARRPGAGLGRRVLHWAFATAVPALPQVIQRSPRLLAQGALGRGLRRAPGALGRLARWSAAWTPAVPPAPGTYPARGPERGRVGLFLGCIGRVAEGAVLQDAVRVLTAYGFAVVVPAAQTCCGAIHLHGGDPGGAAARARRNLDAFSGVERVVGCASGCTAALAEYPELAGLSATDRERARGFAAGVADICAFLDQAAAPEGLSLAPLPGRVRVHDPCTLTNVLRAAGAPYRLLERVPALEVLPLAGNDACCGSAGTYVLEHPATAAALVAPKAAAAVSARATWVATANVGCALHLRAALGDQDIAVVHPLTLLARAIAGAGGG